MLRPRTLRALTRVRETGVSVIVVTGRMFRAVKPYLDEAGLREPVVCYQGAVVADPTNGEFLRHEPIPLELAREAIAAVEAEGFGLNCYVDDELYVADETPEARRYAEFQHIPIHVVGPLLEWLEEPPTKLVTIGEPHLLDALEAHLKGVFRDRLYIAKSLPFFLELASPDVTKASGMEFVARHLGLDRKRIVGVGDGENDIELLEWAGYAVAVANAHERVLALADLVAPSAAEEGVAHVIEAFLDRS
ncbi:MAG: HAD family hydrolase [Actinomycetota bacterium]|nr:HAD family hydrolase [Actinomycetota bacterium]